MQGAGTVRFVRDIRWKAWNATAFLPIPRFWPVAAVLLGLVITFGCGKNSFGDFANGASGKLVHTFGQLIESGTDEIAHYTEISLSPAGQTIYTPASGVVSFKSSLDGKLNNCLVLRPSGEANESASGSGLEPGLPHLATVRFAFCNLANSSGEIAAKVGSWFEAKGYLSTADPDDTQNPKRTHRQIATEGFLAGDPDFDEFDVKLSPDDVSAWTAFGAADGGRLKLAAYKLVNANSADADGNRLYINPLSYLKDALPAPFLRAQAPSIENASLEFSQNADMSNPTTLNFDTVNWTAPNGYSIGGYVRIWIKLGKRAPTAPDGPTASPYAISYTLKKAGTTAILSLGDARMRTIDVADVTSRAPHLYVDWLSVPSDQEIWHRLIWDTTSPVGTGSSPQVTDASAGAGADILNLTAAVNDGQILSPGAYELRVEVRDVFTAEGSGAAVTLSFSVGGVPAIDIDVDSDMQSGIDANDDPIEMNDRALIVYVNNDDDGGNGNDAMTNSVIENANDRADLTPLIIRQVASAPQGAILRLSAANHYNIRIFDQHDVARIGPPAVDGGPDKKYYDIPLTDLIAGDITYLVEAVHGGLQTLSLILYSSPSLATELARDELKLSLNVDREPGSTYATIRNRVTLIESVADLEGLKASLSGPTPVVSWDPSPPHLKTTSFWVSIQDNAGSLWLQTGVRVRRSTAGIDSEETYFEFVPDYKAYKALPPNNDPTGYQVMIKPGAGWDMGEFKVELTDRTIGAAKASYNGVVWQTAANAKFKTAAFENYQIGVEPKQTVSRVPGTPTTRAAAAAVQFKSQSGWVNSTFVPTNIKLESIDGRGQELQLTTIGSVHEADLDGMHFKWIDGQTFEIWDDRN